MGFKDIDWQFEGVVLLVSFLLICMLFILITLAGMFITWDYRFAFELSIFKGEIFRIIIVLTVLAYAGIRIRDL